MNKKNVISSFLISGVAISTFALTGCANNEDVNNLNYESPKYNIETVQEKKDSNLANIQDEKDFDVENGVARDVVDMQKPGGTQRQKGSPSEEEIGACENKSEGDICIFALIDRDDEETEIEGECKLVPMDEDQLICVSENMKRGPGNMNRQDLE